MPIDHQNSQKLHPQVAFGTKDLIIRSTGEVIKVPKAQRKQLQELLWRDYAAANTDDDGNFYGVGRTKFLELCHDSTGSTQKALGALDNIAVRYGTEMFTDIEHIISLLSTLLQMSESEKSGMLKASEAIQAHVKYDLGAHLQKYSACSKHCFTHLLSNRDPTLKDEQCSSCPEACGDHSAHCKSCDGADIFFASLVDLAKRIPDADRKAEVVWRTQQCIKKYGVYFRHEVRGHWEAYVKSQLVENMGESTIGIWCDWKMKFLMSLFRESMVEFFGKAGIPWHGSMFMMRQGDEVHIKYAHDITDDRKECAFSVLSSMHSSITVLVEDIQENGFGELGQDQALEVEEAFFITDGARCYSGKHLCISLHLLSQWVGVRITDHIIGESQKNKSSLDGNFAVEGARVNRSVATGEDDVRVAFDIVRALAGDRHKSSKSHYHAFQPNRAAAAKLKPGILPGISKVSHREYAYDSVTQEFTGMTLRHQSSIGNGKFYSAKQVLNMWDGTPQQPTGVLTMNADGKVRQFAGPVNPVSIVTDVSQVEGEGTSTSTNQVPPLPTITTPPANNIGTATPLNTAVMSTDLQTTATPLAVQQSLRKPGDSPELVRLMTNALNVGEQWHLASFIWKRNDLVERFNLDKTGGANQILSWCRRFVQKMSKRPSNATTTEVVDTEPTSERGIAIPGSEEVRAHTQAACTNTTPTAHTLQGEPSLPSDSASGKEAVERELDAPMTGTIDAGNTAATARTLPSEPSLPGDSAIGKEAVQEEVDAPMTGTVDAENTAPTARILPGEPSLLGDSAIGREAVLEDRDAGNMAATARTLPGEPLLPSDSGIGREAVQEEVDAAMTETGDAEMVPTSRILPGEPSLFGDSAIGREAVMEDRDAPMTENTDADNTTPATMPGISPVVKTTASMARAAGRRIMNNATIRSRNFKNGGIRPANLGKRKRPIFASEVNKRKAKLEEEARKGKRVQNKLREENDKRQHYLQRLQNSGNGMPCENFACTRVFLSERALQRHTSRNACTGGTNVFRGRKNKRKAEVVHTYKDKCAKAIQQSGISTTVRQVDASKDTNQHELSLVNSGDYTLLTGKQYAVLGVGRGHCCKASKRTHKVYTKAQVDFIRWTYYQGVEFTANKYSPSRAANEMKLHGTQQGFELHRGDEFWVVSAYGQCTFSYKEELDHDIFRGWFMNIKAAFDKAVATARKRQVKTVHDLPALDLKEEEGGDDDD